MFLWAVALRGIALSGIGFSLCWVSPCKDQTREKLNRG